MKRLLIILALLISSLAFAGDEYIEVSSSGGGLDTTAGDARYILLNGGNTATKFNTPYAQTLVVAKSGGDYTTITAALAAITDAATGKRYCIKVMPGTYVEAITMKQWVDVIGSGYQSTIIQQGDAVIVVGASNSMLQGVNIDCTGTGTAKNLMTIATSTTNISIEDCLFTFAGSLDHTGIEMGGSLYTNVYIRRCIFMGAATRGYGIKFDRSGANTILNNVYIENCTMTGTKWGISCVFGSTTATVGIVNVRNCNINASQDCITSTSTGGVYNSINSYNNTYTTGTIRLYSAAGNTNTVNSYGDTVASVTKSAGGGTETFNSFGSIISGVSTSQTTPNVKYLGIGDGTADQTEIESAISACNSGDTLVLASGTYTINDDIDISVPINIIGQGVGKTTIACATAAKNCFHITSDNVTLQGMTISNTAATGGNNSCIWIDGTAGAVFTSLLFKDLNLNITTTTGATPYAIYSSDAGGTLSNVTVNYTPGNGTATRQIAVDLFNAASAEAGTTWNIYNCNFTAILNSTDDYMSVFRSGNGAVAMTSNLYNSTFTCSNLNTGGSSSGLHATSAVSTVNAYNCTFSGYNSTYDGISNGDAAQWSSATVNAYQCIFKNNVTVGNICNRTADDKVVATTLTNAGITHALSVLPTTGGECLLQGLDYDNTATVTIPNNNITLRGAGKSTRLLATNRTTFASYTGTPAAGNTMTGVTSTYTAVCEKVDLVNKIVWYHTLSNAANFTTGETINWSGGGTTVNIAAPTEQNFHAVTAVSKTGCVISGIRFVGGSGGGNTNDFISSSSATGIIIKNNYFYNGDGAAIEDSTSNYIKILGNHFESVDGDGAIIYSNSDYGVVSGNTFNTCGIHNIIWAGDSGSIVNNTSYNSTTGGADIYVSDDNCSIIGNTLTGSGTSDKGIHLDEADYCTVEGNVTLGHDVAGIQEDSDCEANNISNNNCSDTTPYIKNGLISNAVTFYGINTYPSSYTLRASDNTVICSGSSVVITLPLAATRGGVTYTIKNCATESTVRIITSGTDRLDEDTSYELGARFSSIDVISDGVSQWYIK